MLIRLASKLQRNSIVDGEGIRAVVWTQGCPHNCPGCHNPETHDFDGGFLVDVEELKEEINSLDSEVGVTLSGGDPFVQPEACLEIAKYCHKIDLNVWCYTGYTYEQLVKMGKDNPVINEFLNEIDVLVDGRFVQKLKSLEAKFRGSKNQRLIDMKETLKSDEVVLLKYDSIKKNKKTDIYI
ncbi:MAG: anaerobic ribonucleoside-triphosphate reductase activating protein [Bacilli bacterium]|nr:anaerobic ribonucleoside-triphosphate reductase activating protein [Bacilli bacterium]